jgi:hypothetical protein
MEILRKSSAALPPCSNGFGARRVHSTTPVDVGSPEAYNGAASAGPGNFPAEP